MKILIATDGSDFSRRAVEQFCRMFAADRQTEIEIVSVVERSTAMAREPFAVSGAYYAQLENESRARAQDYVAGAEKILRERLKGDGFSVGTKVFTGRVKRTIIDEARDFKADLIVVGSHGEGFFERALLGSISDFVIHHAPCPVLVVRTEKGP